MSSVMSLITPSHYIEFESGWCAYIKSLFSLHLWPCDDPFIKLDDKLLLRKSSQKSDIFDIVLFACRDTLSPIIPSFIKDISDYAFQGCFSIETVIFASISQLETIECSAFFESSIRCITIPSTATKIGKKSFCNCFKLKKVEFLKDSKLEAVLFETQNLRFSQFHRV